ncbi:ENV1 protein, partial [Indicator maculatus]|nr:ENV1 protein [Indicator maculatus]
FTKAHEGLTKRRKERENSQAWYETWFNQSPWLTTLLPTIMRPVILLLLALTFRPHIINKLVAFVNERIEKVHVMMIRKLQPISITDPSLEAKSETLSRLESK